MSYLTSSAFERLQTLPISLPQTELRRQKTLQLMTVILNQGQRLELRSLHLHLLQILTPGVVPSLETGGLGLVSVGFYLGGGMLTGGIGVVGLSQAGVASYHPAQPVWVTSPGVYRVVVANNSSNVDVTVLVTGSLRIFS